MLNQPADSTRKDGEGSICTERFDYHMDPESSDADVQDHKHSLNGVFSHALDVADKSNKSRELKKTFKSLLGLLHDDLGDEGNGSHSTVTGEDDSRADATQYSPACDAPLPFGPTLAAVFRPHTGKLPDQINSHKDLQPFPWTEMVHDIVNSMTVMSRRAAGVPDSDICPDSNPAGAKSAPSPRRQIKRPRLTHQMDGYDADADDSEGG